MTCCQKFAVRLDSLSRSTPLPFSPEASLQSAGGGRHGDDPPGCAFAPEDPESDRFRVIARQILADALERVERRAPCPAPSFDCLARGIVENSTRSRSRFSVRHGNPEAIR